MYEYIVELKDGTVLSVYADVDFDPEENVVDDVYIDCVNEVLDDETSLPYELTEEEENDVRQQIAEQYKDL